jgi:tRNA(Ile)-lysidine synthase TilS/MesJ
MKINSKWLPQNKFTFLVSGGVDSISAAHWLKYKYRCKQEFDILHFNHACSSINDKMEESVKRFADFINVPCKIIKRDKEQFPDESEGELRKFRFFHLTKIGGNYVTAHHANDCEESYILNCLNGVPQYIPIKPYWCEDPIGIYHPFLLIQKKKLNEYMENVEGLKDYLCEDPTNSDPTHCRRNWIRNVIIPELRKQGIVLHNHVKKYYV